MALDSKEEKKTNVVFFSCFRLMYLYARATYTAQLRFPRFCVSIQFFYCSSFRAKTRACRTKPKTTTSPGTFQINFPPRNFRPPPQKEENSPISPILGIKMPEEALETYQSRGQTPARAFKLSEHKRQRKITQPCCPSCCSHSSFSPPRPPPRPSPTRGPWPRPPRPPCRGRARSRIPFRSQRHSRRPSRGRRELGNSSSDMFIFHTFLVYSVPCICPCTIVYTYVTPFFVN